MNELPLGSKGGTVSTLDEQDIIAIHQVIQNLELEIAFIKSKLRGERFIRTRKKNPKLKTWITKNMFLITLFWQLIFLTIVAVFEFIFAAHEDANSITNWIAVALGALFQLVEIIFLIVCSVKLVKQLKHKTASTWFLIQSFLCYVIFFAGVYTLLCKMSPYAFVGVDSNTEIFELYNVFLYFSVTTIATVGFGDITASSWLSMMIVMVEALLSVVFTTVIFAKGLTHLSGQGAISQFTSSIPPDQPDEQTTLN